MAQATLVIGPSLGAVCVGQLAALMQRAHHAQRCAVGCCRQAPCVAVSEHPRFAPARAPGLQLCHHAVRSYPSHFLQMNYDFGIMHEAKSWVRAIVQRQWDHSNSFRMNQGILWKDRLPIQCSILACLVCCNVVLHHGICCCDDSNCNAET